MNSLIENQKGSLKFKNVTVQIQMKEGEEVDLALFRWVALGPRKPPKLSDLPEGSIIYCKK